MPLLPIRRWLRFSIRTLLVAVTIFCVWLGWQWRLVHERRTLRARILEQGGSVYGDELSLQYRADEVVRMNVNGTDARVPPIPLLRRVIGDERVLLISSGFKSEAELALVRGAFPEAQVLEPQR